METQKSWNVGQLSLPIMNSFWIVCEFDFEIYLDLIFSLFLLFELWKNFKKALEGLFESENNFEKLLAKWYSSQVRFEAVYIQFIHMDDIYTERKT